MGTRFLKLKWSLHGVWAKLIIPNAVIEFAPEFYDSGVDTSVTVLVAKDQVEILVQAMRDGSIDLVSIPTTGAQQ
jgi:FixJ family two-component response regulator